jgi:hypothetical protein
MYPIQVVSTRIEKDLKNGWPTIVYTDEYGEEWVHEEQVTGQGLATTLVKKLDSYYWQIDK